MSDETAERARAGELDLYCLACGYNQRGILSDRCPECGRLYADAPPSPVRIPWMHRRYLGRLWAYAQTMRLVLFRPGQFRQEMMHTASYRDARRFWGATILLTYLPLLAATAVWYFSMPPADRADSGLFMPIYSPVFPAASLHVGLLLFIAAATGWPSYYCHPRHLSIEQQNRAIALSYYASAPLGLMPAATVLVLAGALLVERIRAFPVLLIGMGVLTGIVLAGMWYWRTASIVAAIAQRKAGWLAVWLLLAWLGLGALLLVFVPLLLHYAILLVSAML